MSIATVMATLLGKLTDRFASAAKVAEVKSEPREDLAEVAEVHEAKLNEEAMLLRQMEELQEKLAQARASKPGGGHLRRADPWR